MNNLLLNTAILILLLIGFSFSGRSATSLDLPNLAVVDSNDLSLGWDEDVILCLPNDNFEIMADTPFAFAPEMSRFNWSYDPNGVQLSDLRRANPVVFPQNPGTYTVRLEIAAQYRNLVVNGDFSSAEVSKGIHFTELALYESPGHLGVGEYAVGYKPSGLNNSWWDCSKSSSGPDYNYMTIDSERGELIIDWQQNIEVQEGVCYEFGVMAVSLDDHDPPTVGIRVMQNGVILQQGEVLKLSTDSCDWQALTGSWMANVSGWIQLVIYNEKAAKKGHDFSIDDIYFRRMPNKLIDEIKVIIGDTVEADMKTEISCFGLDNGIIEVSPTAGEPSFDFQWKQFPDSNSNIIHNVAPGTYELRVVSSLGCSNIFQATVAQAPPIQHRLDTQNVTCFGGNDGSAAIFATGAPPLQLLWNTGSTAPQLPNLHAGPYRLTITDTYGCTKTIDFRIFQPDEVRFEFRIQEPSCHGIPDGTVFIDNISGGTPPFRLSKDSLLYQAVGTGPVVLDNLFGGNYAIITEDSRGCIKKVPVYLSQPEEVRLDLGADTTLHMGDGFHLRPTLSGALISWQWRGDNLDWLSCTNCPYPFVRPRETSTFELTIADANGCSDRDSIIFFIVDPEVYIPNAFTPNGDGVNDRITVYGGEGLSQIYSLRVFDRWGILLFSRNNISLNMESKGWDGRFNGQEMDAGVYVLIAEVDFLNGRRQLYKQDITLIR